MTAFHAAFSIALDGRFDDLWPHLEPDDRTLGALAVYRNTATKGRIDALEANYPAVVDMVGRDWFRAAAREYVEVEPGDAPVMAAYGGGFPAWLARFEPARSMAYLSPAARLDRAWIEAYLAGNAPVMIARQAANLGLALTGATVRLHPSARLFWFDWSAPSLWLAHRDPRAGTEMSWRPTPEGLLIHRPGDHVLTRRLSRAQWAFLDAGRRGASFAAAAMAAQAAQPRVDIPALFAELIAFGVFMPPSCPSRPS
ncbi:DNA-binding domain-containing protein [Brevundimonas sp. NPDC058933]|uniref:HvfC/BufC N-terminal domain-containing protein n=1 Tax=Brevundimonas sp. NPDC058933 TaxID=3346673 RepID=UPI003BEEB71D